MKRFKKRPSPAMIVAMTALFISLVGTAVAGPIAEISLNKGEKQQVRKISRNISGKVSNRRISKRAPGLNVATARNAVIANVANASNFAHTATSAKNAENAENAESADTVADGAITTPKLANDSVTGAKLGAIQRVIVESATADSEGETRNVTASCPAGRVAISGGAAWVTVGGNVSTVSGIIRVNHPVPATAGQGAPTGWQATGLHDTNFERRLRAYAICLAG